jgi:ATP-dependent Clp protease, protease subunit
MNCWSIQNKSDRAEIWIYEMIGEDFFSGGGIIADAFRKDLATVKASKIDLHINSPGGDVFDGLAIYNLLKQHPAKITTYIDGIAASIASVIALAGDEVYMAENALFMIHNPRGMVFGESSDMRKRADVLDTARNSISKAYLAKTGKDEQSIFALMDAETWMDASDALDIGFIDGTTEKIDMAACAKFVPIMAKAGFKQVPAISGEKPAPTAKDANKALRNVGFSRQQAKIILAKGISEYLRNVDDSEDGDSEDAALRNVEGEGSTQWEAVVDEVAAQVDSTPVAEAKPTDKTKALFDRISRIRSN